MGADVTESRAKQVEATHGWWNMRQRSRFTQTVNGATTTITLQQSQVGWEVKGWQHQIGDVKSHAEGNPYLHETFSDYQDAVTAYKLVCHQAVDEPGDRYVKPGPMVPLDEQERIDDAARMEHAEQEQARLTRIFNELKEDTDE